MESNIIKKIEKNIRTVKAYWLSLMASEKYLVIKAQVNIVNRQVIPFNWGDDMNFHLTTMLSHKTVIPITDSQLLKILPVKSYLVIGSTISFYSLDGVTVWGAGIINQNEIKNIRGRPEKICAVRGPLTRQVLIELGYDCPPIYGDPILLLPRFYQPRNIQKKHKIGIIPHYIDKKTKVIKGLKHNETSVIVIDIQDYGSWEELVDDICSCEAILSSSLHGLICSEAYGIPSVWISLSEYVDGWDFKFNDFFLSIGKDFNKPIKILDEQDIFGEDIRTAITSWEKGIIDLDLLLKSCPFYIG